MKFLKAIEPLLRLFAGIFVAFGVFYFLSLILTLGDIIIHFIHSS